ncbi:MAG TPA: hydantoinase/oxoprolinase family protein [Solirubrobacteraceae bacterium]
MPERDLHLGVDVGATYTDAVVIDGRRQLVAKVKVPTTPKLGGSIAEAVHRLAQDPRVDPTRVTRAMLGTTRATDVLAEPSGVKRVAVLRIGGPSTLAVPPLATWPDGLRGAVSVGEVVVGGGAEYDGRAAGALDVEAIERFLDRVAGDAQGVAIAGVFSPVAPDHELAAAEIVCRQLGRAVPVSLSHEIGSVGLLERENATVLNAALVGVARSLAAVLDRALAAEGIDAEPFFAQNDGTVMALEHALRFPVLMIGSGPANSMRGAAYLSGVVNGAVVDVGGSTTNVGVLVHGYPRPSPRATDIAGVRMDFRMPEVFGLPFGGGTVVDPQADPPAIGPASVGDRLAQEALVFGGETATLTDAAVAGGRADIGSHRLSAAHRRALSPLLEIVDERLADAIDRAKGALPAVPLVVVGGGSGLVAPGLAGVTNLVVPADAEVASAIGVAIAPVSGQADRICPNRPEERERAREEASRAAFARAIHAGADPDAVDVVEVEEVPLTSMVDPAVRIRVRAVGPRS